MLTDRYLSIDVHHIVEEPTHKSKKIHMTLTALTSQFCRLQVMGLRNEEM